MKIYVYYLYGMRDYCGVKQYISDSYISDQREFLCRGGKDVRIPIRFIQHPFSPFFSFKKLTKKQIDCLDRELNDLLNMPGL